MSLLSGKVRERLEQLSLKFAGQLPDRVRELRAAVSRVRANSESADNLEQVRGLAHRLAGSGSTFGFKDVSAVARRIEHRARTLLAGENPGDEEELETLVDELEAAAGKPQTSTKISLPESATMEEVGPSEDGYRERIVLLWLTDEATTDDLFHQLGFFGFPVERIDGPKAIEARLDRDQQVIVIIDVNMIRDDDEGRRLLPQLKDAHSDCLSIIFVSQSDTYEVRLGAVRFGGDAFFASPLEISQLIDAVESLAARNEARPYHVLIVDDDPDQVSYLALTLQKAGMLTAVATDPRNVFEILVEEKPELILMDMYMPGATGVELAKLIRQQEAYVGIPIIFISSETDPLKQFRAISQGGDDFISKPVDPIALVNAVRIRAERSRSMRFFMERDSLTGLLNHSNLREKLGQELQRAGRMGSSLCLAMIDLDNFKSVNDTYGHLTGDRVLKSLARLLQERLRRTDIIGRYGGEEFAVILFDTTTADAARIMAEIRESFSHVRQQAGEHEFYVTLSCGIAGFPAHGTMNELTEAADTALYEAKEAGRNLVVTAGE
ncbi:MAG: diguanylate cyclase [Spirochaetaceae bacterium]